MDIRLILICSSFTSKPNSLIEGRDIHVTGWGVYAYLHMRQQFSYHIAAHLCTNFAGSEYLHPGKCE